MNVNLQVDSSATVNLLQKLWLAHNRGVLTEVALKLKVSPQAVSAVYKGKRRSAKIERALKRKGATLVF